MTMPAEPFRRSTAMISWAAMSSSTRRDRLEKAAVLVAEAVVVDAEAGVINMNQLFEKGVQASCLRPFFIQAAMRAGRCLALRQM